MADKKSSEIKSYRLTQKAHCAVYGCKKNASIAVGKRKFDSFSTYLCEEHAREYYDQLRMVFNANMVGDDEIEKQMEIMKSILVTIMTSEGDKFTLQTLYEVADNLNVAYGEKDSKRIILANCLKFMKGGTTDGN